MACVVSFFISGMKQNRKDNYIQLFDEINNLVSDTLKEGRDIEDEIEGLLFIAYAMGRGDVEEDVGYELETKIDVRRVLQSINKDIEGKTYRDRVLLAETLEDVVRIAETEFHRVYNEGSIDGANEIQKESGYEIQKTWITVGDDRVRPHHVFLEGESIGLSEEFVSPDGDTALFPGGFNKAENNINCRCVCEFNFA